MSFLKAIGGVIEGSWTRAAAQRRGSGVGAFLAVPLSLRPSGRSVADNFLALGVGYQHLRPTMARGLASSGPQELSQRQSADMPYSKLSLSLAVPLMRGVPGLLVGLSYSRLWSRSNAAADDLVISLTWRCRIGRIGGRARAGRAGDQQSAIWAAGSAIRD